MVAKRKESALDLYTCTTTFACLHVGGQLIPFGVVTVYTGCTVVILCAPRTSTSTVTVAGAKLSRNIRHVVLLVEHVNVFDVWPVAVTITSAPSAARPRMSTDT